MDTFLVCVTIFILLCLIVPPIVVIGIKLLGRYLNWLIDKFKLDL